MNNKAAGLDDSNFGTKDRRSKTCQKVETYKSLREIIESNAKLDYLLPHANTTISDNTSYIEGTIPSNNQDHVIA